MATATIVKAWKDDAYAYLAARIGKVEITGRLPRSQVDGLTPEETKARLAEAVKAERDKSAKPNETTIQITGTIDV